MITTVVKKVFKHLDRNESELVMLRKQIDLRRGYLHGAMDPIDLDNPKIYLDAALERREKGSVQIDSFFGACQKWHNNFEDKGVQIKQANLNLMYHI